MPGSLPEFLNVDLVLESRSNLDPLIAALARRTIVLACYRHRGYHHLTLELAHSPKSAGGAIRSFVRLIQGLPPSLRKLWLRSRRRDFDVGVDMGRARALLLVELPPEVVRAVSSVRGRITLTLYPPMPARRPGARPRRRPVVRLQ